MILLCCIRCVYCKQKSHTKKPTCFNKIEKKNGFLFHLKDNTYRQLLWISENKTLTERKKLQQFPFYYKLMKTKIERKKKKINKTKWRKRYLRYLTKWKTNIQRSHFDSLCIASGCLRVCVFHVTKNAKMYTIMICSI